MQIIKRVLINKATKTKYIIIPMDSDIHAGDYVEIVKVDSKIKDGGDKTTGK